jgi:hypothetical protein
MIVVAVTRGLKGSFCAGCGFIACYLNTGSDFLPWFECFVQKVPPFPIQSIAGDFKYNKLTYYIRQL